MKTQYNDQKSQFEYQFIKNKSQFKDQFYCKCGSKIIDENHRLMTNGNVSFLSGTADFYCTNCGHLVGYIHDAKEYVTLNTTKYFGCMLAGNQVYRHIQCDE